MPSCAASRSRALTTSAPAWWPSTGGRARARGRPPVPSVMIAPWRGLSSANSAGTVLAPSDLHDLGLFGLQRVGWLGHPRVRELLELLLGAALVVLAGLAGVLELAQVVHDVAADVADRHAALLGDVADDLDELAAALLVELRHLQADQLAVVVGREPNVGLHDRLLDRLDRALVVGLDGQQPRLGGVDGGELLERRLRAVVVDDDAVEQRRAGAAGAHRAELPARRVDGLLHALAGVGDQLVGDIAHQAAA